MRIHLLHLGVFAGAVASAASSVLTARGHQLTSGDAGQDRSAAPSFWPAGDLHVLIAGRQSPHLERLLDRSVVESRTPAATIVFEHPRLRLGPLVNGQGACLGCLQSRRAQHDSTYQKVMPLLQAYDANPRLEPTGHLPHQVALAVGWLTGLTDAIANDRSADYVGRVSYVNVHTGASNSDPVVGVHACPRCRQTPPLADSSWRELARDLATVGGGDRG